MNNHFKNKNKKNHWWGFQIFDLSQIPKFWSIFLSQIRNFLRKKKTLSYLSCQLSPKNWFFKFKPKGKIFSSSKFFFYSLSLSLSSLSLETALSSSLDVHDVHFSLVTAAAALPSSVAVADPRAAPAREKDYKLRKPNQCCSRFAFLEQQQQAPIINKRKKKKGDTRRDTERGPRKGRKQRKKKKALISTCVEEECKNLETRTSWCFDCRVRKGNFDGAVEMYLVVVSVTNWIAAVAAVVIVRTVPWIRACQLLKSFGYSSKRRRMRLTSWFP